MAIHTKPTGRAIDILLSHSMVIQINFRTRVVERARGSTTLGRGSFQKSSFPKPYAVRCDGRFLATRTRESNQGRPRSRVLLAVVKSYEIEPFPVYCAMSWYITFEDRTFRTKFLWRSCPEHPVANTMAHNLPKIPSVATIRRPHVLYESADPAN